MSISKHQIDEAELGARTTEMKSREEYPALKNYLIGAIASGRLTARLQAKAYNDLGLVHLQLDEPEEAEKAFLSATERDADAVNSASTDKGIRTCQTVTAHEVPKIVRTYSTKNCTKRRREAMNTKLRALTILTAFLVSGLTAYAQNNASQDSKIYPIETRLDNYTRPITFTPTKAEPVNGAIAENIVTTTQNILNKEAGFLKKGLVKPVGEDEFSAWEMVSDEGGKEHSQTAPNPLTYYAAGASSSLLTQVERLIQIMDLDVEDVKVESKIYFRWSDAMTGHWTGYTDKVISNILMSSNETPEKIVELKERALQAWAVGEGLANPTPIDVGILINADEWAGLNARPGKVGSPISIDHGRTITNVTPDLDLETVEVERDLSVEMHQFPNPFVFSEISIAESAHDAERPYLHKIRAKSLTENYQTWELYADDSRGYEGIDKAPTSRDYFTVGTSFCLMSQLTVNRMYYKSLGINIDDFRVEHQFNYQQDNFMTPTMTGHLDRVITKVIVSSEAAEEACIAYAKQALAMCFAGEGVQMETEMESNVYLNGKIVR